MTVVCRFVVDAADFDIGRALGATTTRVDLTQFVPVDGQLMPYFWKIRGGEKEAFERSVLADPAVASLVDLDGRVDATLYRVEWTDEVNGFLDALRTHDILVEAATTPTGKTWKFEVRAPTQGCLSDFQQTCYDHGIRLDVRQFVHNPDDPHERLPNVTPKQREALSLALEEGYFEVPRGTTLTALAEKTGISRQSFSRRLQRAHKTVTTDLLEGRE